MCRYAKCVDVRDAFGSNTSMIIVSSKLASETDSYLANRPLLRTDTLATVATDVFAILAKRVDSSIASSPHIAIDEYVATVALAYLRRRPLRS